ncbi:hypothetical protein CkaCkLH20_05597 [Colletotrichum karsti]|uniref:AAA+ ATPase domain-containing protein n=1 Tax=Colletotrichum karsti TaxID=1095194 RepID=A0A9P6LL10_9PEZI|nr:uncharacterized protein CkaCkLH20_05597 [Colletotrichum karsti]KAF9876751.1 hypothetical protein CkaCkLH20_05597 [Colletotrichum karsti]
MLTQRNQVDARFMVDYETYRKMHPNEDEDEYDTTDVSDLGHELMNQDHPPLEDDFFMCLPTTMVGFNMQKKEWVKLGVAFMEDVVWNEEAFKYLVIDERTKELVQAVVTTKLRADKNTDLIVGKGNGLFILLHGGPGTGKTLTAESVAEVAKKPLYRVTCGDIGTKAEDVEKYLKIVLLLGKTWGCVVLLDEADVFLEERTLQSLERNALVSVFLRVLEYYDGILILTSNRVGTFDEAFKSRIQLNLRYENLDESKRLKIWGNFINRVENLEMDPTIEAEDAKGSEATQQKTSLSPDSNEWLDSERPPDMNSLFDDMVLLYPLTVRTSTASPNDCNDICRKLVLAEWTARLRIIEAEIARERLELIIPRSGAARNIAELLETSWPGFWRPKDFARLVRAKTILESITAELRQNLRALGVGPDATPRILSPWETDAWESLHEAAGLMVSKVEGTMQAYMQASSVRQMLSANEQAVQVGRLTSMATIFLPVSLVATIFSMGGEFAAGERMFWVFWVIAVPVGLVGCFLLFTTAGRNILR